MSESIVKDPNAVQNYISEIRALADTNKSALGFLPANAYRDACMRSRLWIAIDSDGKLCGYLFFGGRYPRLSVFQIFVRPEFRGSGIARKLLKELREYGEELSCLTISAKVATELEANAFWKASGFTVTRRIARKATKRPLNVYTFELDAPSLFRSKPSRTADATQIRYPKPLLSTPSYVIDLNVFFDIVKNRDIGESTSVLSLGLDHEILLYVTPEFAGELERHRRKYDPVLEFARRLPTLPGVAPETINPIVEDLRTTFYHGTSKTGRRAINDASDLRHLAYCIHYRAYGFITRDATLLKHSEDLHRKYDLNIVSPADFSDLFDNDATRHESQLATVDQRDVRITDLDEQDRDEVEKFLHDLDVDPRNRSSCLAPGTTQRPRLRRIVRVGPRLVGVGSWAGPGPRDVRNLHLYVDEDQPSSKRAIDRLFLESSISAGIHGRLLRLDLNTAPRQEKTRGVAINIGFRPPKRGSNSSGALTKMSFTGVVGEDTWSSFRQAFKKMSDLTLPDEMPSWKAVSDSGIVLNGGGNQGRSVLASLFDFETLVSPCVFIFPDRVAVMVPIRTIYARELIATTEVQQSFLPDREATFRLERAYFLRAGRHKLLPRGTIVVFYVSRPRSEAVALARVTFSDTLTKTQAVLRLGRQGVLTESEIDQKANRRGEIAAFTFDNLLAFHKPIPFRELQRDGCISRANLVTAQELSHRSLVRIVNRAFEVGR